MNIRKDLESKDMLQFELKDAFKMATDDQDKVMPPQDTVSRFEERAKAVNIDVLAETRRIDNGRLDIPVFFSVCGKDAQAMTGTRKQMGKGATPEQSRASAVMELVERFSFFSHIQNDSHFTVTTYDELEGPAIPLSAIALSVHDNDPDQETALSFFRSLPMKWARAWNLTRNRSEWIPFDWFYAINEFNGPSAGNCNEEAICQGISEIVERHVSARICHEKIRVPAIRLDSVRHPVVRDLISKYRKNGIELIASDFSLDTGIPTIGVLAWDPATFPEKSEIVWTAGTAPDPEKALSRALTEVAQLGGDFNSGSNYEASGLPKFRDLADAVHVAEPDTFLEIDALPDISDNNIRKEIENAVSALSGLGMDVYVMETTHPELKIPAFYTIVPGAHFRERARTGSVAMFCAKLVTKLMKPSDAIALLNHMDKTMPNRYAINYYAATMVFKLRLYGFAMEIIEKALTLNPPDEDRAGMYALMGQCCKEIGRYREAADVLEKGANLDPERTDIWNLLGFCLFKLENHPAAISCFEKVLALNPGSAIDYANIASNYRDMGETEKAIEYYRTAICLDPSIEFAMENLIRLESTAEIS